MSIGCDGLGAFEIASKRPGTGDRFFRFAEIHLPVLGTLNSLPFFSKTPSLGSWLDKAGCFR